ncbi:MAG TPA: lytic murein transglycosylase B [Ramlibacter sp.]
MRSAFHRSLLVLLAASALACACVPADAGSPARRAAAERSPYHGTPYAKREDAMDWAEAMAQRRGLGTSWVRAAIGHAQMLPVIVRLVQPAPPGQPKNWQAYRSRFIEPRRIAAGVEFWKDNEAVLARAQQDFGVPPEIIVGIIGVETIYGQQMGNFRVLDALATLAFDFPASHPRAQERTDYFRGELEQFLVTEAQRKGDPRKPLGSYAGAMGMAQFMPGSWAKWAIDYDGDGRIDLRGSAADVIGSVANYFKSYGWQPGLPTHYPVSFDPARLDLDALLAPDILPTFTPEKFTDLGAVLDTPGREHPGKLALIELQNGDNPPEYVAGTENFYVITRYNWSSYYAMAVIELGQEVKSVVRSLGGSETGLRWAEKGLEARRGNGSILHVLTRFRNDAYGPLSAQPSGPSPETRHASLRAPYVH